VKNVRLAVKIVHAHAYTHKSNKTVYQLSSPVKLSHANLQLPKLLSTRIALKIRSLIDMSPPSRPPHTRKIKTLHK